MTKKIQYKIIIAGSSCKILSKITNNNGTEIDSFFQGLSTNYSRNIDGLLHLMQEHAKNGSDLLTLSNCHHACKSKDINIYEYRKGQLRIYWFYDAADNNIVICSHGVIKRAQQTAKKDKDKSIKEYKTYHNHRESIEILEND